LQRARDLAAERQEAQLVALTAKRLYEKNRKAEQRKKKREKEARREKASQLKIQLEAAKASRGPYVESIWSRRGPVARRDSLLVKIASDEESMLAVATLIWRWDRATGWNQVDVPPIWVDVKPVADEETMVKPDLSTKEGKSEYNRTYYNKRKAAGKVGGETETKRPYNRTYFPKREPGNQGFKQKTAEMTPGETKNPHNRSCFPKRLDERVDYSTLPSVVTWFSVSPSACAMEMELCKELDAPQNAAPEDQNEEDISHTVPLAAPEDTTEETPLATSEDKKQEDKDISHSVLMAASMPWGGVSWGGMMGSAMELDAPQNAAPEDKEEEDISHTAPLTAPENKNKEEISHTVPLAVSEDTNEKDISHTVPLAAPEDKTEEAPLAASEDTTEEAPLPACEDTEEAQSRPNEVDRKWLEPCKEVEVKWLELCKELDAKAAKTE
jgi:hypothetical protein